MRSELIHFPFINVKLYDYSTNLLKFKINILMIVARNAKEVIVRLHPLTISSNRLSTSSKELSNYVHV